MRSLKNFSYEELSYLLSCYPSMGEKIAIELLYRIQEKSDKK